MNDTPTVDANLAALIQKIPQLHYVLKKLEETPIRYGLYAGSHVAALAGNRIPTDVDLLVHDDDLPLLKSLFPFAKTRDDGNGVFLYVGKDDVVEFMGRAEVVKPSGTYEFRLSDAAALRLTTHTVDGVTIRLVDPVDSLLLKSILQRGKEQGKHDIDDMEAVLAKVEINTEYLRLRLKEANAADHTREIWKKFGIDV